MTTLNTSIPAILAQEPDNEKVSSKYSFIPTTRVIEDLESFGWRPRIASGSLKMPAQSTWSDSFVTGFRVLTT